MFFFDGQMNIEKSDICYTCKRTTDFKCPLFNFIAIFPQSEEFAGAFNIPCPLYEDKRAKLKVVK